MPCKDPSGEGRPHHSKGGQDTWRLQGKPPKACQKLAEVRMRCPKGFRGSVALLTPDFRLPASQRHCFLCQLVPSVPSAGGVTPSQVPKPDTSLSQPSAVSPGRALPAHHACPQALAVEQSLPWRRGASISPPPGVSPAVCSPVVLTVSGKGLPPTLQNAWGRRLHSLAQRAASL